MPISPKWFRPSEFCTKILYAFLNAQEERIKTDLKQTECDDVERIRPLVVSCEHNNETLTCV
jgi:hypothetical protein